MVELQTPELDAVFHALGDPTRRQMLHALSSGERSVGELAEPFDMSLAAASKHIKVLEGAGLVTRRTEWREHMIELRVEELAHVDRWFRDLRSIWALRLEALDHLLTQETDP